VQLFKKFNPRLSVRIQLFCVLCSCCFVPWAHSQDSLYLLQSEYQYADNPRYTVGGGTPKRHTELDPITTIGFGAGYAALVVGLHINQANAWWSEQRSEFRIIEDIEYARFLDKFGHFYASYAMSTFCGDMLKECGMENEAATLVGAGMGVAYQTYVEIEDGYGVDWGFSPSDAIANVAGSAFTVAQMYIPVLENFTPRWSYVPNQWAGFRGIDRPKTFIDDYNSTTFWLACNVNNLLPNSIAEYWPDWMMLSVGYGIYDYGLKDEAQRIIPPPRRYLVGIDYDWVKIIPESNIGFVNYLRQVLNYLRLPGPTVEFGDRGTRFGLLYPFVLSVRF
jgi:hypothetical protein